MNEKQVTKIVGVVLFAALVVVGIKVLVNHLYGPEGGHEQMAAQETMGEPEPMAEAGEAASEEGAGEEAAAEPEATAGEAAPKAETKTAEAGEEAAAAPAGGDAAAGKKVWQSHLCFACHSFEPGKHGAGPSLAGVWGHKVGETEGFDFSDAMKSSDKVVDAAFLDEWVQGPQEVIPGTKMILAKPVTDAADRANLIAYIKEESAK